MGKVVTQFTLSLDGFIADREDGVGRLMRWYRGGDTPFSVLRTGMVFHLSAPSAAYLQREWANIGAIVTGRRDFDVSKAWGGASPFGVPIFIVTHQPPQEWIDSEAPFTFVTSGVADALTLAQQAAAEQNVIVSGSSVVRQALNAALVDEILIDLVPVLLGGGVRLFEELERTVDLEKIDVIDAPGVTHLKFRVVK